MKLQLNQIIHTGDKRIKYTCACFYHKIRNMTHSFECIYDGEVFRPLEKINLKKGERLTVHIECHHSFDPIKLNMPITDDTIQSLRKESWTSF